MKAFRFTIVLSTVFICLISCNTKDSNSNINTEKGDFIINDYFRLNLSLNPQSIVEKTYYYDDSSANNLGEIQRSSYYTFNEAGFITEVRKFGTEDIFLLQQVTEYDSENIILKKLSFDADGNIKEESKYVYDDDKNLLLIINQNHDNGQTTIIECKNNEIGEIVEMNYLNEDSIPIMQVKYSYDEQNKISEIITLVLDNNLGEDEKYLTQILYDSKGQASEKKYYEGENNLVRHEEFSYEHNDKQNWIKQHIKNMGVNSFVVTREIVYF